MEDRIDKLENRVDALEEKYNDVNTTVKLLKQAIDNIDGNIVGIFAEIKELRKMREQDHYVKPLDKTEKLRSQVIGIAIGFFVAAFLAFLFPHLGGR